jgi:hypothetical protein
VADQRACERERERARGAAPSRVGEEGRRGGRRGPSREGRVMRVARPRERRRESRASMLGRRPRRALVRGGRRGGAAAARCFGRSMAAACVW